MHRPEHYSVSEVDLQGDQMSLPWGLPYLLKVQGKADGWGWQQPVGQSVRARNRNSLFSLTILFAFFHSFTKLMCIKLFCFFVYPVISLLRFQTFFPSAVCSVVTRMTAFILNWGISLDTHGQLKDICKKLNRICSADNLTLWINSVAQRYLAPFMFTAVTGLQAPQLFTLIVWKL